MVESGFLVENWKPCLVMTVMAGICSTFMILLQFLLSNGIDALVLIVYNQAIATVTLSSLAFFFEKGKRPPLTFEIVRYAFLLGVLQVTVAQLFLTVTVRFAGATFQSVAMSTTTIVSLYWLLYSRWKGSDSGASMRRPRCGVWLFHLLEPW